MRRIIALTFIAVGLLITAGPAAAAHPHVLCASSVSCLD